MNKRKYPFNIDMCPQLKIHIGEKQLANGVLKSMKMSEVYGLYLIFNIIRVYMLFMCCIMFIC